MSKEAIFIKQLEPREVSDEVELNTRLCLVASSFGYIFVGGIEDVCVYHAADYESVSKATTEEELDCTTTINLSGTTPTWLAVSCDGLTLAVCAQKSAGCFAYLYDVREIAATEGTDDEPSPFAEVRLSSEADVELRDFQWSPAVADMFVACLTNGSVSLFSVTDKLTLLGRLPDKLGALCLSWSPKGKQLVCSLESGALHQYDTELKLKRVINITDILKNMEEVKGGLGTDIVWVSNFSFLLGITTNKGYADEDGKADYTCAIITAPKEGNPTVRDLGKVCYPDFDCCAPIQFSFHAILEWRTVTLALRQEATVLLLTPDFTDGEGVTDDLIVVRPGTKFTGIALDRRSKQSIPRGGDQLPYPPSPLYIFGVSNGTILGTYLINTTPNTASPMHYQSLPGGRRAVIGYPGQSFLSQSNPGSLGTAGLTSIGSSTLPMKPLATSGGVSSNHAALQGYQAPGTQSFLGTGPGTGFQQPTSNVNFAQSSTRSGPFQPTNSRVDFGSTAASARPAGGFQFNQSSSATSLSQPQFTTMSGPLMSSNSGFAPSTVSPRSYGAKNSYVTSGPTPQQSSSITRTTMPDSVTNFQPSSSLSTTDHHRAPNGGDPSSVVTTVTVDRSGGNLRDALSGVVSEMDDWVALSREKNLATFAQPEFLMRHADELAAMQQRSEQLALALTCLDKETRGIGKEVGDVRTNLLSCSSYGERVRVAMAVSRDSRVQTATLNRQLDPMAARQLANLKNQYQNVESLLCDVNSQLDYLFDKLDNEMDGEYSLQRPSASRRALGQGYQRTSSSPSTPTTPRIHTVYKTLRNNANIIQMEQDRVNDLQGRMQRLSVSTPTLSLTDSVGEEGRARTALEMSKRAKDRHLYDMLSKRPVNRITVSRGNTMRATPASMDRIREIERSLSSTMISGEKPKLRLDDLDTTRFPSNVAPGGHFTSSTPGRGIKPSTTSSSLHTTSSNRPILHASGSGTTIGQPVNVTTALQASILKKSGVSTTGQSLLNTGMRPHPTFASTTSSFQPVSSAKPTSTMTGSLSARGSTSVVPTSRLTSAAPLSTGSHLANLSTTPSSNFARGDVLAFKSPNLPTTVKPMTSSFTSAATTGTAFSSANNQTISQRTLAPASNFTSKTSPGVGGNLGLPSAASTTPVGLSFGATTLGGSLGPTTPIKSAFAVTKASSFSGLVGPSSSSAVGLFPSSTTSGGGFGAYGALPSVTSAVGSQSTGMFGKNGTSMTGGVLGSSAPGIGIAASSTTSGSLFSRPVISTTTSMFATSTTASLATQPLMSTITSSTGVFNKPAVPTASSSGLFGASSAVPTGIFGGTSSLTTTTTTTTPGSIFGGISNVAAPSSTGIFGKTTVPVSTGGLFGTSSTPSSGSIFSSLPASATSSMTSSAGIFGNTFLPAGTNVTSTKAFSSTGLFGTTAVSSSSIFGSSGTTASGGFGTCSMASSGGSGLFGNTTSTSTGVFGGSSTTASSGLFATSATTTTSAGGLFGSTTNSGGLFGTARTTSSGGTSLFGAPATTSSGNLFGGAASSASSSPFKSAGLFSAPQATTSSTVGFSFSSGQTSTASSTTGSIFGQGPTAPTSASSQFGGGGSIFSQPASSASPFQSGGGSLFGSTQQQTNPSASSGGLFGTVPSSGTSGSLFGSAPTTTTTASSGFSSGGFSSFGLGGQPSAERAAQNVFGSAPTAAATTGQTSSLFGSGSTAAFGAPTSTAQSSASLFASQPSGGGLFGSTATSQSSAGGLFGTAPASTAGFGSTATSQSSAGGLFGSPAVSQSTGGGGLFGTAPASTGGFGSTPTSTFGASGGGLFGAASTGFGGGPAFGGAPAFGSPPAFGVQTSTSSFGAGGFGSTTNGGGFAQMLGSSAPSFGSLAHTSPPHQPQAQTQSPGTFGGSPSFTQRRA